jgi:hypothetical protein
VLCRRHIQWLALFGGRRVGLVLRTDLSRWIRDRVLADAQVMYDER